MAEGNDTTLKLSLDARDALATADALRNKISSLGSSDLSGLIQGISGIAGPMAAVGLAAFAVKKAFDMTLEGEALEKISNQFKMLSEQAGISSEKLEAGIAKSTQGFLGLDDSMKLANSAIIRLGKNSERIPEIFELAKKAASGFGGTVEERFEQISTAISTGNTRMLRSISLNVEADKALGKFAHTLGITASSLSETGKQQALLNAVLEKGNDKFKGIKTDSDSATASWRQLKIAANDFWQDLSIVISKTGVVKTFLKELTSGIRELGREFRAGSDDPIIKTTAHLEFYQNKLKQTADYLEDVKKRTGLSKFLTLPQGVKDAEKDLIRYRAQVEETQRKLSDLQADKMIKEGVPSATTGGPSASDAIEQNKAREAKLKFEQDMLSIKSARIKAEMDVETEYDSFFVSLGEQRLNLEEGYNLKKKSLEVDYSLNKIGTESELNQKLFEIEAEKNAKLSEFDRQRNDEMLKLYANQVKGAHTVGDGIAAGFKQGAALAKKDMNDYGAQGVKTFDIVKTGAKKFFIGLGEGSKSASELMKGFLLNSLADYAEMKGEVLLADGIGSMNPVAIAEGGALLAMSGAIRAAAGSAGSTGGASGVGGGVGGGGPSFAAAEGPQLQDQKKKSVTIQVMGNYFETEQTKRRLVEMVREETDATDFKYQQIGVS